MTDPSLKVSKENSIKLVVNHSIYYQTCDSIYPVLFVAFSPILLSIDLLRQPEILSVHRNH